MKCSVIDCPSLVFCRALCSTHYRRLRLYGDVNTFQRTVHRGTPAERFDQKTDKSGECWTWQGTVHPETGYGSFWDGARVVLAHRYAYALVHGAIPSGAQIDHKCHARSCVNPSHLRLASNKENCENLGGVRVDNRCGARGVGLNKRTGKYRARVTHEGREHYAGEFVTVEEAAAAAKALRLRLFTHNDLDRAEAGETAVANVMAVAA